MLHLKIQWNFPFTNTVYTLSLCIASISFTKVRLRLVFLKPPMNSIFFWALMFLRGDTPHTSGQRCTSLPTWCSSSVFSSSPLCLPQACQHNFCNYSTQHRWWRLCTLPIKSKQNTFSCSTTIHFFFMEMSVMIDLTFFCVCIHILMRVCWEGPFSGKLPGV